MKEHRHPHPHVDPRQPRDNSAPLTNPPVFVWKPVRGGALYHLVVARDAAFTDIVLQCRSLREPCFLPEKAFPVGRYYWKWATESAIAEWWLWSSESATSEIFTFEITPASVVLEIPQVDAWLAAFPAEHPRLYTRPENISRLRNMRHEQWQQVQVFAKRLCDESHDLPEPPFLADFASRYEEWIAQYYETMWASRNFLKGAETLALAYLTSGEAAYGRAACRRLLALAGWDPYGASYLGHNDEAHMSVIEHGPIVFDWIADLLTEEERRRIVAHFRERGKITFEHMHDQGCYGITRFDSHAGREVIFLALLALAFHEAIPEARIWLAWLRPVLCGIWPIWATDDGAWAEGQGYATPYVMLQSTFASALRTGTGINLYLRPFWRNHLHWRRWCLPSYAEWMGFGDQTERWEENWGMMADVADVVGEALDAPCAYTFARELRAEGKQCVQAPGEREATWIIPNRYMVQPPADSPLLPPETRMLRVFPGAGCTAIRTSLDDPARDVAFIFRSSPYGSISHSHANNNDFIIHAGGKVLAMPSGYYVDGWGSPHHAHWVWHTKSHNCLTLSDAGQLMRSPNSQGAIEHAYEDENLSYFAGNADASYADRALRCRRHVLFLKAQQCFILIDEFVAKPGILSAVQWNIHS